MENTQSTNIISHSNRNRNPYCFRWMLTRKEWWCISENNQWKLEKSRISSYTRQFSLLYPCLCRKNAQNSRKQLCRIIEIIAREINDHRVQLLQLSNIDKVLCRAILLCSVLLLLSSSMFYSSIKDNLFWNRRTNPLVYNSILQLSSTCTRMRTNKCSRKNYQDQFPKSIFSPLYFKYFSNNFAWFFFCFCLI